MATVWILAASNNVIGSPLVKADAVTGFIQTGQNLEVLGIHPGQPVPIATRSGDSPDIPEGFHLDLLRAVAQESAANFKGHMVIVADNTSDSGWSWKTHRLDEFEWPKR